jgi:CheY-like chemotaxis protein
MDKSTSSEWNSSSRRISGSRRRRYRILVVDDYDDTRAALREAIERAGYAVVEASNGQQALNFLVSRNRDHVDLVIVDLHMPVMDGWTFIDLLRCYVNLSTIPIIVVTAAQDAHLERITHRAVRGCFRAPYELKALMEMVAQIVKTPKSAQGAGTPKR